MLARGVRDEYATCPGESTGILGIADRMEFAEAHAAPGTASRRLALAAAFGSLLLFTIALQVITGILLTMNYAPSVETAYPSVKFIQEEVPFGWFIRALHHWGASAMVVLLLFHMVQVFVWGAYKRPRELTWMVGVVLLFCTLGLAFTGYLLPRDQKAYWASKVGLDIVGTVPVVGVETASPLRARQKKVHLVDA